ncbi:uncharacterized protein LOC119163459 isoform X2 [Rhipicephalus microplus]|uniref:uncharacterized protein LOC119163459 isoform X2 n=1 Tax=Rhipicephalus microplus TaxID=6941 RepID=UPI003F6B2602
MPRSCDVLGCPNGAGNSSVSYHVVPRDERRRSQWLAAVPMRRREGRAPPKLMVCSEHFSPSDYVYDPSLRQSLGCHQRPALSRSAVPSVARLARNELVLLQQEILEGVLPLVVSLVKGKPSPSWHQANKLICADSCVLPSRVTPADLRELAGLSPLRNSYESITSTTSTSSEHVEFSPLDMLDVTLVEGQPLSLQSKTRTDDCYLSTGKTSVFSANNKETDMQALFPPNHWRRTCKTSHRGIGHNKIVQVTIHGKSIGTQVNMTMKGVMSEGLQADIGDAPLSTSTSTQT